VRESTGSERLPEAKRFLEARKGAVVTGAPVMPRADRVPTRRPPRICGGLRTHGTRQRAKITPWIVSGTATSLSAQARR
jgi:hypothetical protein